MCSVYSVYVQVHLFICLFFQRLFSYLCRTWSFQSLGGIKTPQRVWMYRQTDNRTNIQTDDQINRQFVK